MPTHISLPLAAELFAEGLLLMTCISHVAAPGAWSRLFQDAFKHPAAGLVIGLVTLIIGLPILLAHWRWTGDLRSIVTVLGWAWTFKGSLYLLCPGVAVRVGNRHVRHPSRFVAAGLLGIGISALAIIGTLRAGEWQT